MTTQKRLLGLTSGVLGCALVLAGCGAGEDRSDAGESGSTTGITDDTIKIGGHFPLTGVAAPGNSTIPLGHKAYYAFVNDNGGVNGRQTEYAATDDAYEPTKTRPVTNNTLLEDKNFEREDGTGTPTHNPLVQLPKTEKD